MLTSRDIAFLTGGGALVAALLGAAGALLGLDVPPWVAGAVFLALAISLLAARAYVWWVGADNTRVDETVDAIEDVADKLPQPPPQPLRAVNRVPPALMVVPLVFLVTLLVGCQPGRGAKTASDAKEVACSDAAVITVDELCATLYAELDGDKKKLAEVGCDSLIDAQTALCGEVRR